MELSPDARGHGDWSPGRPLTPGRGRASTGPPLKILHASRKYTILAPIAIVSRGGVFIATPQPPSSSHTASLAMMLLNIPCVAQILLLKTASARCRMTAVGIARLDGCR